MWREGVWGRGGKKKRRFVNLRTTGKPGCTTCDLPLKMAPIQSEIVSTQYLEDASAIEEG